MAPAPLNKLLILLLYFYSGDEYILSSIVSWSDLSVEKNVGGLTKDESCLVAKSLIEWWASHVREDHAFLYLEEIRGNNLMHIVVIKTVYVITIRHIYLHIFAEWKKIYYCERLLSWKHPKSYLRCCYFPWCLLKQQKNPRSLTLDSTSFLAHTHCCCLQT